MVTKYRNNNTRANKKKRKLKRKENLEEDLLVGGTDVGRIGRHEDRG